MAVRATSVAELQSYIDSACSIAVENTCNRLLGKLQEFIMSEFYDAYTPEEYKRTWQFYQSATTQMVSEMCGKIFMNPSSMKYKTISGEWQLRLANEGFHGSTDPWLFAPGFYFKKFETYCNENALKILKQELKKQGLKVK